MKMALAYLPVYLLVALLFRGMMATSSENIRANTSELIIMGQQEIFGPYVNSN